jgi:hypothetical protein
MMHLACASAVAGIVTDYKRRRGSVDVIRIAIEKGQQLDRARELAAAGQTVRGARV